MSLNSNKISLLIHPATNNNTNPSTSHSFSSSLSSSASRQKTTAITSSTTSHANENNLFSVNSAHCNEIKPIAAYECNTTSTSNPITHTSHLNPNLNKIININRPASVAVNEEKSMNRM